MPNLIFFMLQVIAKTMILAMVLALHEGELVIHYDS